MFITLIQTGSLGILRAVSGGKAKGSHTKRGNLRKMYIKQRYAWGFLFSLFFIQAQGRRKLAHPLLEDSPLLCKQVSE